MHAGTKGMSENKLPGGMAGFLLPGEGQSLWWCLRQVTPQSGTQCEGKPILFVILLEPLTFQSLSYSLSEAWGTVSRYR